MTLAIVTTICLTLGHATHAQTQTTIQKGVTMSSNATGPFEVKIDPQPADEKAGGAPISRMLLDKKFHGDLEATSRGTMLAAGNPAKGNGGYVALENVTGTLKGHTGTFVLQHTATMIHGVPDLSIIVVPDSGTGQLTGISGKMNIIIADGKHSYNFEYTLANTSDKP